MASPTAPPIWTVGPSRPSANPLPMEITPPMNLTGKMRFQSSLRYRWRTASRCGIPLPAASGANRRVSATDIPAPNAQNRIGKTQPHNGMRCAQEIKLFRNASAPVSAARKPRAINPAPAPTSAARGNIQRRCCLISRYSWISERADMLFSSGVGFVFLRELIFEPDKERVFQAMILEPRDFFMLVSIRCGSKRIILFYNHLSHAFRVSASIS